MATVVVVLFAAFVVVGLVQKHERKQRVCYWNLETETSSVWTCERRRR